MGKMILSLIFAGMMAWVSSDYTPSSDVYFLGLAKLLPVLNTVDLFDQPYKVSTATTTPSTTIQPTLKQMKYYNYYAASMYCPYKLKKLSCEYCQKFKKDVVKHSVLRNDVHNTLALITLSHKRKEIVVAYRGTMNVWNVILDVLMISDGKGDVKLHKGFYIATMSLYNDVVAKVRYLIRRYRDYKIVICGHSLGGAMARITQYFFHYNNEFPEAKYEVYTYGEPRTGNRPYVDFLNNLTDTTARIVARADIASHIPPTSVLPLHLLGDDYLHVQTEFWIDGENGQRFCDQTTYEDHNCSMSLGPLYSAVDHLTYFDVNVFKCFGGNPFALTSLPLGFPQLPSILPPLPTPISNLSSGLTDFGVRLLSTILGR